MRLEDCPQLTLVECKIYNTIFKSPFDSSIIKLNPIIEQSESQEFNEWVNIARNVLSQPALAEYIGKELFPVRVFSNAELEDLSALTAKSSANCHRLN